MEGFRKMLRAKIHRARVTHADLHYEGSISIPPHLLQATGILPFEAVDIWNVTSGTRLQTYAISGKPGSGDICVNGAAAHLVKVGDLIIIAAFALIPESAALEHRPTAVFVDERNQIKEIRAEIAGPDSAS